jgi:hypothetical protein
MKKFDKYKYLVFGLFFFDLSCLSPHFNLSFFLLFLLLFIYHFLQNKPSIINFIKILQVNDKVITTYYLEKNQFLFYFVLFIRCFLAFNIIFMSLSPFYYNILVIFITKFEMVFIAFSGILSFIFLFDTVFRLHIIFLKKNCIASLWLAVFKGYCKYSF